MIIILEKTFIYRIRYLKTILPSFHDAKLVGTADELYIRETRHIKGGESTRQLFLRKRQVTL